MRPALEGAGNNDFAEVLRIVGPASMRPALEGAGNEISGAPFTPDGKPLQ